ncbi:uncharacterized protein [Coffea arabica]|uniref:Transcription repressor n=1 Tax=Coffea arabica TaxID=13443 RepID=A0A6P6UR29_COFAR|nr:transcription repressor OFP7-like [Coffea arabica]
MTKPFKLRLHLPSFQLCRSRKSSTNSANSPSPVTRAFTSTTPKAFDIAYPSPAPPPSTPIHLFCKRNISSKILPISLETIEPLPCTNTHAESSCNVESPGYRHNNSLQKLYNSPEASDEFDQSAWPFASFNAENSNNEGNHRVKDQSAATSFSVSISSADSGWFSSEEGDDPNDESEGLLSTCSSLESSCDFGHPVKTPSTRKPKNGNVTRKRKKNGKVRKLKRYVSNTWKDGEKIKLATTSTMPPLESDSSATKTVLGRLLPCGVDGKVNESYAIVKKSADPFDDFKMSMLEMILEKEMSEPEELEKLLMCFLSLNSKEHHGVIVAAFTEVWEELFSSDSKP